MCQLSDKSVFHSSSALCDPQGHAPVPILSPGDGTRAQGCSGCASGAGSCESGKELWLQVKGGHFVAVSTAEIPEQPRG